jgi:hypothetical protein
MARKRPSQLRLRIDEKSVLFQLELPIGFPKRLIMVIIVAIFIHFNPELWNAVQAAVSFFK